MNINKIRKAATKKNEIKVTDSNNDEEDTTMNIKNAKTIKNVKLNNKAKKPVEVVEEDEIDEDDDLLDIDDVDTEDEDFDSEEIDEEEFDDDSNADADEDEEDDDEEDEEETPKKPVKKAAKKEVPKKPVKKAAKTIDEDEEDDDDEEETPKKPVKKAAKKEVLKKPSKSVKKTDEDEEEDSNIPEAEFGKGTRFYVPEYDDADFGVSTKFANRQKSLARLVKRLKENEYTKGVFDDCESAADKKEVAGHILNAVFQAMLDTNLLDGSGFTIGNGSIKMTAVSGKVYNRFGERMEFDTFKFPHIKLAFDGGEFKQGFGAVYTEKNISELSVAGNNNGDGTFEVVKSTAFVSEGDIISSETGEIISDKPKKTAKPGNKKKIKK